MNLKDIYTKWRDLVEKLNDKGVPLPMVRDPQTLEGSVSLTLVVISSMLVIAGIMGKWSGKLGGIDMNSAFNFFYASTTLYFGHGWVHNKDKSQLGTEDPQPTKPKVDDPDA